MGMISLNDVVEAGQLLNEQAYRRISPYFIPKILANMAAGQISLKYRLKVSNHIILLFLKINCHPFVACFFTSLHRFIVLWSWQCMAFLNLKISGFSSIYVCFYAKYIPIYAGHGC